MSNERWAECAWEQGTAAYFVDRSFAVEEFGCEIRRRCVQLFSNLASTHIHMRTLDISPDLSDSHNFPFQCVQWMRANSQRDNNKVHTLNAAMRRRYTHTNTHNTFIYNWECAILFCRSSSLASSGGCWFFVFGFSSLLLLLSLVDIHLGCYVNKKVIKSTLCRISCKPCDNLLCNRRQH